MNLYELILVELHPAIDFQSLTSNVVRVWTSQEGNGISNVFRFRQAFQRDVLSKRLHAPFIALACILADLVSNVHHHWRLHNPRCVCVNRRAFFSQFTSRNLRDPRMANLELEYTVRLGLPTTPAWEVALMILPGWPSFLNAA